MWQNDKEMQETQQKVKMSSSSCDPSGSLMKSQQCGQGQQQQQLPQQGKYDPFTGFQSAEVTL